MKPDLADPLRAVRAAALALACASAGVAVAQPAASAPATAGSLSGKPADAASADCAARRKAYLASQACFERYRNVNGSVKPAAAKRCRDVVDPSPQCGPNLPTQ